MSDQVKKTIEQIDLIVDKTSARCGILLNWQNPSDPFWHYGIGLSDTHIFDTGQGLRVFEKEDARFVLGIEHIASPPDQTIKRLRHALCVFADWGYTLPGWNCEHLARLIATDQPRCYQSRAIWWMCDLTPDGDHKTARKVFREYLRKVEPGLLDKTLRA